MQVGLTQAVTPFLESKGWDGSPHRFVTWWRRTHFENSMIDSLCDRGHTSYREIGQRAVSFVMDRCGISYTREEVSWLVGQIETLKPFPDVIAALEQLRLGGYKLAILSNGDRDMLQAAQPTLVFRLTRLSRFRRPAISSHTGRLMRVRKRYLGNNDRAVCLSPTMCSTAWEQSPSGCVPLSSTGAIGRLAKLPTSLISSWRTSPGSPRSWCLPNARWGPRRTD